MLGENSNTDPAAALGRVIDDQESVLEARQWTVDRLLAGDRPEEILHAMLCEGWDPDRAELIVETARKETRADRGILTREQVLRDSNLNYHQATAGLSVSFRSGLFGLYGFTTGFMAALRHLRKLKQMRGTKHLQQTDATLDHLPPD